jgi:hypothetical protein
MVFKPGSICSTKPSTLSESNAIFTGTVWGGVRSWFCQKRRVRSPVHQQVSVLANNSVANSAVICRPAASTSSRFVKLTAPLKHYSLIGARCRVARSGNCSFFMTLQECSSPEEPAGVFRSTFFMTPAVSCSEAFRVRSGQRMMPDDLRALTPLIYAHVTPYGTFRPDMSKRLAIDQDSVAT